MADEPQNTGVGVFLIPAADDPIVAASSEQAHLTTIWMGDMNDLDPEAIEMIRGEVAAYSANLDGPVVVPTTEQGELGDEGAVVQFLEPTEALLALREGLLEASPAVSAAMNSVEQFPQWTPHVTLGYPETPQAGEYDGDAVTFDRVGLWVGDEQQEWPMGDEMARVVDEMLASAREKLTSLTADASSNPIDDQSDLTESEEVDIDDEMPVDELEDDEELITEIPVHGVATVEGRATGDGRGFRAEALDFGPMPQPLGYEYTSTHGGDTSNVAVIGRIDEYWRQDLGDGVFELRWRGVVMPGKEYGAKAIESIVDGSYTGLSVIVDSVELDVDEERAALRTRILADRADGDSDSTRTAVATDPADDDFDIEALLDDLVGDGTQPVTWFRSARVRRFDMVPTGAFSEAYIALGHEFADELTADQLVAAAAALEDCGCLDDVEDLSTDVWVVEHSDGSGAAVYGPFDSEEEARAWSIGDGEYAVIRLNRALVAAAFRDVPPGERKKLAESGNAMPDGSYPIANVDDLRNAIQAIGRAKDPEAVKRHIKKRARQLGEEDLIPEGWSMLDRDIIDLDNLEAAGYDSIFAAAFVDGGGGLVTGPGMKIALAPGTHDGPGWITHPIPTARIRRYWVRGKGAAKIGWGTPGDFNRCRAQLAKYVQNPEWLAGLCSNMHKEAIGVWPGQEASAGALVASGATPAPLFITAAAAPVDGAYFQRRELANPRVGIVVEDDAVYGYIAQWNVCHVGIADQCTLAPHSPSNYGQFRTGTVMTTDGPVPVGQITMNTGHANGRLSPRDTVSHYDNTGAVAADIACGEDRFGIWFAGRIRPSLSDEDRFALAASGRLSGDWRTIGGAYELMAALVVNVPGYPIPNVSIAASAEMPLSLVAAGVICPDAEEDGTPILASAGELTALTADDLADIALAAAEQALNLRDRQEIEASVAPAREKLASMNLARARAQLTKG